MNKKGFTLVELLGVIIILAIIVILAVPNVINVIKESKIKAFENDIKSLSELIILKYETKSSTESINSFVFTFPMSDGQMNSNGFQGTSPSSGRIYLQAKTENGIKYAEVIINKVISSDGKLCAIKGSNDKDAIIIESSDSRCQ